MHPYLRPRIALPQDHGSWVFLLSPLLIGAFAAGSFSPATLYLLLAALAAFLMRQPATVAVKALSGRRSRRDLPVSLAWIAAYILLGLLGVAGLLSQGFAFILVLAIPGTLVFAWHLYLVSRRAERHQVGVDVVASGALALAAPAAYWVGLGQPHPLGWWLWLLTWLQSAASIVYAFLRLEQRAWDELPPVSTRVQKGLRVLLYTTFNLSLVGLSSTLGWLPPLLPLPFALQWLESLWGALVPAIGYKPTRIGLRQFFVSLLFTLLFILAWRLSPS